MSARNAFWTIKPSADNTYTWDQAQLGTLMDIRDELKKLNSVLMCPNFQDIPRRLKQISRNTAKPCKKKKKKKKNQNTPMGDRTHEPSKYKTQ